MGADTPTPPDAERKPFSALAQTIRQVRLVQDGEGGKQAWGGPGPHHLARSQELCALPGGLVTAWAPGCRAAPGTRLHLNSKISLRHIFLILM